VSQNLPSMTYRVPSSPNRATCIGEPGRPSWPAPHRPYSFRIQLPPVPEAPFFPLGGMQCFQNAWRDYSFCISEDQRSETPDSHRSDNAARFREPMPSKTFVWLFTICAAVFVPVPFDFGLVAFVLPCAYLPLVIPTLGAVLWALPLLGAYCFCFVLFGFLFAWVSEVKGTRRFKLAVQFVAILALFSCSFIRAISYSSIQRRGGTYNLWGAAARYLQWY
jgi:hypothetical protein